MAGAEALIRYQDENGSIIEPDRFIPILEDTYFISKIDYYVFEEVCKNLSAWSEQGYSLLRYPVIFQGSLSWMIIL